MALEIFVQRLDGYIRIPVLRLLFAQVSRLIDRAHPALAERLLEHEAGLDNAARANRRAARCCPVRRITPASRGASARCSARAGCAAVGAHSSGLAGWIRALCALGTSQFPWSQYCLVASVVG